MLGDHSPPSSSSSSTVSFIAMVCRRCWSTSCSNSGSRHHLETCVCGTRTKNAMSRWPRLVRAKNFAAAFRASSSLGFILLHQTHKPPLTQPQPQLINRDVNLAPLFDQRLVTPH